MEELQIGVIVYQSDASMLFFNPMAEKIIELSNNEILGKTFDDYDLILLMKKVMN